MACAVPKHRVTVDSYRAQFGDESVERFVNTTGIRSQHLS